MAYHDLADLYPSRLTEAELIQLTNDETGGESIVEAVYEERRGDAEAEIDSYLGVLYALPLAETPPLVKRLSITMTIHALYQRRFPDGVPEGVRAAYTDAVALLRRLADGSATLGVQPRLAENSSRTAAVTSHTAVFSRRSLRGF